MAGRTALSAYKSRVDSLLQGIDTTVLADADRQNAVREAVRKFNKDAGPRGAVEFSGDGGAYYLLYGKVVNIAESNRDAGITLKSSGADERLAISFTLDREMTIHEVALYLRRVGSTVAGTLEARIYTNSSALPGDEITSVTGVDIDDTAAGAPVGRDRKVRFTLSDPITLPAGTYHVGLRGNSYTYGSGSSEVILGVQQSGSPTNTVSAYDGTSWSAYGTASAGILEVVASTPGWRSPVGRPLDVEYPAADISANEEPNILDRDQWETYRSAEGLFLRFAEHRPSSSETVRLTVDEPYIWIEASDPTIDIPEEYFEPVSYLAASLCCQRLANKFGQKRSSTLQADVADRRSQGDFYRSQAKTFLAYYEAALGIGKGARVGASTAVMDIDLEPPHGAGFLFHGKRRR